MWFTLVMAMTWIDNRNGEAIEVVATMDEDGDFDVRPVGNEDPYANWTVFADEIEAGTVQLIPA